MKHLYIIGNGFDIHTGLRTRYVDFRLWLENNYPFLFENMQAGKLLFFLLSSMDCCYVNSTKRLKLQGGVMSII